MFLTTGGSQDSSMFSTFLGTQPFPAHILPCLEELAKELQTNRHSTQLNNRRSTVPVCQSMQINFLEDSVSHCASMNMSSCLRAVSPGEQHAFVLLIFILSLCQLVSTCAAIISYQSVLALKSCIHNS